MKGKVKKPYVSTKICKFCVNKWPIDYKDTNRLRGFINERGKIISRRVSGNCAWHQRELTREIKKSRNIALLPFSSE